MSSFLPQKTIDESQLELAFNCMENGYFSAAFQILNASKSSERADILFALGICLFSAEDYAAAVRYFEQALSALKCNRSGGVPPPKTETYKILRKNEISGKAYLKPFCVLFTKSFFESAKENITIALAEALVKCGNTDKAKIFINSLSGDEFSAIKELINTG